MTLYSAYQVKRLPARWETQGWVRSLVGEIPWRGNSNPLWYSCWKIPWMEKPGAAYCPRVANSQTWLSDFTFFLSIFLSISPGEIWSNWMEYWYCASIWYQWCQKIRPEVHVICCKIRFATRKMCAVPHANCPQLGAANFTLETFF